MNRALLTAAYGLPDIVNGLLSAGADPDFTDATGDTPLIVAVFMDQEDIAIRLIEAGADTAVTVQNKDRTPSWKKAVSEVVAMKGMARVAAVFPSMATLHTEKKSRQRVDKPQTVEACWTHIGKRIASESRKSELPLPYDISQLLPGQELLQSPSADLLRVSLDHHDGSGDMSLIAVPEEEAYCLLSVADATATRETMMQVFESERGTSVGNWWARGGPLRQTAAICLYWTAVPERQAGKYSPFPMKLVKRNALRNRSWHCFNPLSPI